MAKTEFLLLFYRFIKKLIDFLKVELDILVGTSKGANTVNLIPENILSLYTYHFGRPGDPSLDVKLRLLQIAKPLTSSIITLVCLSVSLYPINVKIREFLFRNPRNFFLLCFKMYTKRSNMFTI